MLEQILELSREMLTLGKQGEWEQVEKLQQSRERLIRESFPLSDEKAADAESARIIEQVLAIDGQIKDAAEGQRHEIRQTLSKLNQGRAATKAYQDTSRR